MEAEGKLAAKRGKLSGKKQVWRCHSCFIDVVVPFSEPKPNCPVCNGETAPLLEPLVINGKIVADMPSPKDIRARVLDQLSRLHSSV